MLRSIQLFLKYTLELSIGFLISGVFSFAHAQIMPIEPITATLIPPNPSAFQDTKIIIKSYSVDLNGASINWYKDNLKIAGGDGLTTITTKAPAFGKTLTITVIAKLITGGTVRKIITLRSGVVDLLWQSDVYTPPLYRGKAVYTRQSVLTLAAMPHLVDVDGKMIDPKKLIYTWKKDAEILGDKSGYGRQTLVIKGDIIDRTPIISVKVTSPDGQQAGETSLGLESTGPKILFYENDSLYGTLYNKALPANFPLKNKEITAKAVPYFFSSNKKDHTGLEYMWNINNTERPDLATKDSITLRTNGDSDGNVSVSLKINNIFDILQSTSAEFQAYFIKKSLNENNPNFNL